MVHRRRQKPGDVGGGDVAEAEERGAASVGDEGIEAVAAGGRRRRDAGVGEEARARHQAPQRRPALPRIRRRRRYVVARDQRDLREPRRARKYPWQWQVRDAQPGRLQECFSIGRWSGVLGWSSDSGRR